MYITSFIEKGLYVLLGVLVTAITNHFLSKDKERQIHKIISFHTAAEKYRHSFDDILLNIEEAEHPVHELLRNFFLQHKGAYWHFKYFFPGKSRKRFKEAWKNYQNFYNNNYAKESVLAQFDSANTQYEIDKRNELRQHIENLIEFTI